MKGDIMREILERLTETASRAGDLFGVFLSASKYSSQRKLRSLRGMHESGNQAEISRVARHAFDAFMHSLKKQGFVIAEEKTGIRLWYATQKGKLKLKILTKQKGEELPRGNYASSPSSSITIISFDIPEVERRKRRWLREALKNLKFVMIHQSVWVGTNAVPEEFIHDLEHLHILRYIEIFAVTKTGTLRDLKRFL